MLALEGPVLPTIAGLLLTTAALGVIFVIVAFFARKVVSAVEDIGESYTTLYKQQHREVMDALQSETRKALSDTKALVMEHTELERILRVLATRAEEGETDRQTSEGRRAADEQMRAASDLIRQENDAIRAAAGAQRDILDRS